MCDGFGQHRTTAQEQKVLVMNASETEKHISENISADLANGEKDASKELREKLESHHKQNVADFVGFCFIDTITRLTVEVLFVMGYLLWTHCSFLEFLMRSQTARKEKCGENTMRKKRMRCFSAGLVGLADDLYSATLLQHRLGASIRQSNPKVGALFL